MLTLPGNVATIIGVSVSGVPPFTSSDASDGMWHKNTVFWPRTNMANVWPGRSSLIASSMTSGAAIKWIFSNVSNICTVFGGSHLANRTVSLIRINKVVSCSPASWMTLSGMCRGNKMCVSACSTSSKGFSSVSGSFRPNEYRLLFDEFGLTTAFSLESLWRGLLDGSELLWPHNCRIVGTMWSIFCLPHHTIVEINWWWTSNCSAFLSLSMCIITSFISEAK